MGNEDQKLGTPPVGPGGAILHPRSRKDLVWEKAFGSSFGTPTIRSRGRLEELRKAGMIANPVYQGDVNSCVPCAFTFINQWFTYKETGKLTEFSWPFLFKNSNPQANGTKPRNVADAIRKIGVCEERFYSVQDLKDTIAESMGAWQNAEQYKIKNYTFLDDKSPARLFVATLNNPIAIGLGVHPDDWGVPGVIKQTKPPEFYHFVSLFDFTDDGNLVVANWWREDEQDIRVLDEGYEVLMAISCEDLPDGFNKEQARTGFFQALKMRFSNTF